MEIEKIEELEREILDDGKGLDLTLSEAKEEEKKQHKETTLVQVCLALFVWVFTDYIDYATQH
jgi:hypothetical protein